MLRFTCRLESGKFSMWFALRSKPRLQFQPLQGQSSESGLRLHVHNLFLVHNARFCSHIPHLLDTSDSLSSSYPQSGLFPFVSPSYLIILFLCLAFEACHHRVEKDSALKQTDLTIRSNHRLKSRTQVFIPQHSTTPSSGLEEARSSNKLS